MRRVFRLPATRRRIDDDVDRELAFHLDGRIEDLMAREGLARVDAEREARRRFGNYRAYRDQARDIDQHMLIRRRRMDFSDTLRRETRQAVRALRRAPSFSIIAVLALTLGLGAATAVFTLLDRVVLEPLPYPNANRLIHIGTLWPKMLRGQEFSISKGQYFFFKAQSRTLTDLLLYDTDNLVVPGDGTHPPERINVLEVSANTFHLLGIPLERGRYFTQSEERNPDGDPRVALLSYEYWQRRFGGDPAVIGTRIPYGDHEVRVIGVLAPRAAILDQTGDLWIRNHLDPGDPPINNHTHHAIALLKPGATVAAAASDIGRMQALLETQYPNVYSQAFLAQSGFAMNVSSLRAFVLGDTIDHALWLLFGGVAVVLLIAAANVANLYLVRIEARRQEQAVRTALGAERAHLAAHYLAESMVLAFIAAALAVLFGDVLLHLVLRVAPQSMPRLAEIAFGWRSIAFCGVVAGALGVVFALLPLASNAIDTVALREGARGLASPRSRQILRRGLVLAQVSLGVVLLAGGGLMAKSFARLRHVDPGFAPAGVYAMEVILPSAGLPPNDCRRFQSMCERTMLLWQQLTTRVGALPGVRAAGLGDGIPLVGDEGCGAMVPEAVGRTAAAVTCMPLMLVTPGYFEALGMRIRGRSPTWSTVNGGEGPLVVTEAFARRFWPGLPTLGRQVRPFDPSNPEFPVVGVAADVRSNGLDQPPIEEAFMPIVGRPGTQWEYAPRSMWLVVRAPTVTQSAVVHAVRNVLADVAPGAPVADVRSMETVVARSTASTSFAMLLLLLSAAIALALSAVGIYGVISYLVAHRRHEIGIRMALGARSATVARLVMRESVALASVGAVIGVASAMLATRLLRSQLFEVSPTDPAVLGATAAVLVGVAMLATLVPVRRATRIDPVDAMRG